MILSNLEIHKALDDRRLILDPEPTPRMPGGSGGEDCPYQTSAVDLRLGYEISYFKPKLPLDINLSSGGFAKLFGPNSSQQTISDEQPFMLRPGRLVLGKTSRCSYSQQRAKISSCCRSRVRVSSSRARAFGFAAGARRQP